MTFLSSYLRIFLYRLHIEPDTQVLSYTTFASWQTSKRNFRDESLPLIGQSSCWHATERRLSFAITATRRFTLERMTVPK
jgi:hypothetical protein